MTSIEQRNMILRYSGQHIPPHQWERMDDDEKRSAVEKAERDATGFMLLSDESQPVDDATLSADIDAMRSHLGAR